MQVDKAFFWVYVYSFIERTNTHVSNPHGFTGMKKIYKLMDHAV